MSTSGVLFQTREMLGSCQGAKRFLFSTRLRGSLPVMQRFVSEIVSKKLLVPGQVVPYYRKPLELFIWRTAQKEFGTSFYPSKKCDSHVYYSQEEIQSMVNQLSIPIEDFDKWIQADFPEGLDIKCSKEKL